MIDKDPWTVKGKICHKSHSTKVQQHKSNVEFDNVAQTKTENHDLVNGTVAEGKQRQAGEERRRFNGKAI